MNARCAVAPRLLEPWLTIINFFMSHFLATRRDAAPRGACDDYNNNNNNNIL